MRRVAGVLSEYLDVQRDPKTQLIKYIEKRLQKKAKNLESPFLENDLAKYQVLLSHLQEMINSEGTYNESTWQKEILKIILLLNPKYIAAFESVKIKDSESNTHRELDILLVDASGNVDVIEIKRPFNACIVTSSVYRNNHIPLKELSGSIMQIEKYIFHLNRWGKNGQAYLTDKYKDQLPRNFEIKITNPCGLIIMGRSNQLSQEQHRDFDVIRRKYKNIVDIITYDDLLNRLAAVINQLKWKIDPTSHILSKETT